MIYAAFLIGFCGGSILSCVLMMLHASGSIAATLASLPFADTLPSRGDR